MAQTRREVLGWMAAATLANAQTKEGLKYVRFRRGGAVSYGILDGDTVRAVRGELFGTHEETGERYPLSAVKLLYPCEPPKVLAVGLNYRSHLAGRPAPSRPEIFYKPVTALQHPGDPILIPRDARNVHYEGELVVVIGRRVKNASLEEARAAIFGYTCGNDVSERDWQNGPDKDLQWWRAKGADTFAPLGPAILRASDAGKRLLRTRLNGEVVQEQYVTDLIFGPPEIVSWVSRYVTLLPGDVIYTGTPGTTGPMKPGDVVEVEIEGIGILHNPVAAAS
ncbi:MAG: fumarylacetoacetate hydrolase family protein [Bryobacterales bacterium]|nr:fumarylacetoacetate hydrolase family protein [Bryobacteraceae bacterium]MDW8355874.1 fumarylacetoacetate hydrolase family protein [Bryobacterales bacterium]